MLPLKLASSSNRDRANEVVNRFFQALISVVVIAVVYRYCWIDASDPFKCEALLNHGEWLDPDSRWSTENPFQSWQPPGCIMHEYTREDIEKCFQRQRMVFIGDSTTRQIFWAVSKKMDQERAEERMAEMDMDQKHKNLEFTSSGVTVQFVWDPWLNSTQLKAELSNFNPDITVKAENGLNQSAGMIMLGAPGLWYARHGEENYFKAFKDSVDTVIPYMDHSAEEHTLSSLSRLSLATSPNLLLLAPVQVPRYQSLSPSRETTITPEKIDQMNDYLQQASAYSGADIIWSYSLMTWSGHWEYEESGLHVIENVAHKKADILLNLRCNADSNRYPFDRTCCSNYVKPNGIQWILMVFGTILFPSLRFLRRRCRLQIGRFLVSDEKLRPLTILGLVFCYCFYADRTQLFEKSHKQFHIKEFVLACFVIILSGLLSSTRSTLSINTNTPTPLKDLTFLSRDQTDEWKGWMQAFILVYHFTHGSDTLWIYQLIRLFVASYLFLTGYGHTMYFLKKKDFSFDRIGYVLIRLNLLSCILPFFMRTDYLFYYFAPLVSFWFLVIYLTMKVYQSKNSNICFVITKIIVSALMTTGFVMVPGILELFAFLLKHTCAITWDIEEWRFRTFLDMYIVYVGMITATMVHHIPRLAFSNRPTRTSMDNILAAIIKHHDVYKTILVLFSFALLSGFWAFIKQLSTKRDYNLWQPYISFVPILVFVTLRNSHSYLRGHHSAIFAWLGRCSLETYVLQYHIWLAGDTKGLLRLGLWNRWVEAAILSAIFLWVSWQTTDATQNLTSWIVRGHLGTQRRNSVLESDSRRSPETLSQLQKIRSNPLKDGRLYNDGDVKLGTYRFMDGVLGDLRWRLGLLLTTMWICNVIYR